jgi:hypothetical protein
MLVAIEESLLFRSNLRIKNGEKEEEVVNCCNQNLIVTASGSFSDPFTPVTQRSTSLSLSLLAQASNTPLTGTSPALKLNMCFPSRLSTVLLRVLSVSSDLTEISLGPTARLTVTIILRLFSTVGWQVPVSSSSSSSSDHKI